MPKFVIANQLLEYPIEILDLSHRASVRLKERGIINLSDLSKVDDDDLLAIYHFGQKSLMQIRKRLQMLNECAMKHGEPTGEIIECLRLKLSRDEAVIESVVKAVVGEGQDRQNKRNITSLAYHLASLNPRQAFVLVERFGMRREKKRTLQDIATIMDLTRERVRQLQNRTLEEMKEQLSNQSTLEHWELKLMESAARPPTGEQFFLQRIEEQGLSGRANPAGFVVLSTHLILGTPIPTLLKAARDGRLYRFWMRRKKRTAPPKIKQVV